MIQRFLLAAASCLMIELATSAAAGLFAPGTEPFLMVGCGLGVLLSALWLGRGLWLGVVGLPVAALSGVVTSQLWQHSATFTHQSISPPIGAVTMFWLAACATGLAALCGWMLFSAREPWPVAALLGSCLLLRADVNSAYAERFPLFAFGILCLVGITFAGRAHVLRRFATSAALAALAIFLAWHLPTSIPAWSQNFADPLRPLDTRAVSIAGQTTLRLTGPFRPANRVVMSVSLSGTSAHPYWWTGVYDQYDGQSWQMTGYEARLVPAGSPVGNVPLTPPTSVLNATVRVEEPASGLVFPGTPSAASRSTTVLTQTSSGEALQVLAGRTLQPGSTYSTDGVAAVPPLGGTSNGLAPDLSAYLQLPDVPSEVKRKAESLAHGRTVLSRVTQIEDYLSSSGTFTYNTEAGSVSGQDAVDYFLFHSRQGYCNQFATAMAVLLREIRIPSRVVTGYVTGRYQNGRYVVKEPDGHTWVEAYIPDRGWVDFEPTPGFALDPRATLGSGRRTASQPKPAMAGGLKKVPRTVATVVSARRRLTVRPVRPLTQPGSSGFPWLITALLFLAAALALAALRRPRSVRAVYIRMARSRLARRPIRSNETPLEFTHRAFPHAASRAQAMVITELYLKQRYGGEKASRVDTHLARKAWRSLRLRRWVPGNLKAND